MRSRFLICGVFGAILVFQPVTAPAQSAKAAGQFVQNLLRSYVVLFVRSLVDFTYESITIDPVNGFVATGVKIYPPADMLGNGDGEQECEISIGRLAETPILGVDSLTYSIEITDLTVPPDCMDREAAGFISSIGYDEGVTADSAVVTVQYSLPDSALSVSVQTVLNQAAALNAEAEFGYFWIGGLAGNNPYPVIQLTRAEISLDNMGLFERLEPMLGSMIGSPDNLPEMARGGLTNEFTRNGQTTLIPAEQHFIDTLADSLTEFLAERKRITVRTTHEGGVWLDESLFGGSTPRLLLQALQPEFSTTPHSRVLVLSPDLLTRAVAENPDLSDEERLQAGTALMTGIGAPRDREAAMKLLVPLAAQGWNAEAAMVIARGLAEAGDAASAYPYALVAMSDGATGAVGLATKLEAQLPAAGVRETQEVILSGFPRDPGLKKAQDAILANPDIGAMRKLAIDTRLGRGVPRNYQLAYLWASLAAAAGDRSAANLRDDLDRMALAAEDESWKEAFADAAAEALRLWTERGLGEAIHAAMAQ